MVENTTPHACSVDDYDYRLYRALDFLHSWSFLLGCGLGLLITIGYFNLTAGKAEAEPLRFPPALRHLANYR
ncbi:MAG: hypothetical protein AAGF93_23510 [Cyanobacteria bacterium P01_H01_bin.105]